MSLFAPGRPIRKIIQPITSAVNPKKIQSARNRGLVTLARCYHSRQRRSDQSGHPHGPHNLIDDERYRSRE